MRLKSWTDTRKTNGLTDYAETESGNSHYVLTAAPNKQGERGKESSELLFWSHTCKKWEKTKHLPPGNVFFFRGPYSPPARIWQKPIIISTVNHMSSLQLEEETSSSHRTKMWFFECLYAFSTQCSHLLTKTPNEFSCRFLILFYFILFHCILFYCIVFYFILSCILSVAVDNSGNSHTV